MGSRRFEIGRRALRHLVNVDRVHTGREIVEIKLDLDALLRCGQRRRANALSLGVFHLNLASWLLWGRQRQGEYCSDQRRRDRSWHGVLPVMMFLKPTTPATAARPRHGAARACSEACVLGNATRVARSLP